jgi:arginase
MLPSLRSTQYRHVLSMSTRLLSNYAGPVAKYPDRNQTISVISTSCDKGQPIIGTNEGPRLLVDSGINDQLKHLGYSVLSQSLSSIQTTSKNENPEFKDSEAIGRLNYQNYLTTLTALRMGSIPLNLTSNHAYGIGPLLAQLTYNPIATKVLWIDAHADINPKGSSPSGNIHGMSVDICMNLKRYSTEPGWEWLGNLPKHAELKPENLAYLGLSSVDWAERNIIQEKNIFARDVHSFRQESPSNLFKQMYQHFNHDPHRTNDIEIHLQWDVDVSSAIKATGTREHLGLTSPEAMSLANIFFKSRKVSSVVITELNPLIGSNNDVDESKELTLQLVRTLFGETILHQTGGILTPQPFLPQSDQRQKSVSLRHHYKGKIIK